METVTCTKAMEITCIWDFHKIIYIWGFPDCSLEEVAFGQSPCRKNQGLDRQEESSLAEARE